MTPKSAVQSLLSTVTDLQLWPPFKGLQDCPHHGILAVLIKSRVQLTSILLEAGRRRQSTAPAVREAKLAKSSCKGIFIVFANLL